MWSVIPTEWLNFINKSFTFTEMCPKRNLLNCWDALKTVELQHNIVYDVSANVAKAEKIYCMVQG